MDSSPAPESTLLQQRLQEKKNCSKTQSHIPLDYTLPRRATAGRDDAIFDSLDSPPRAQRPSGARLFQSSPANAALYNSLQSRRTTSLAPSTTSSSQRTMGAREMGDHVDKLSKQNFDLKLEVYHRREKIDELEKKLQELSHLRADNEELVDLNNDLVAELDTRDRAVDEAVVMICDLEERLRDMQSQLDEQRPRTAKQQFAVPPMHRAVSQQDMATPARPRKRSNSADNAHKASRSIVSPHVSRKMTELAVPEGNKSDRRLPSFIDEDRSTTKALRSLYVEDDRRIRALPSRESLLSGDDEAEDFPKSPAMSVLSESEFKSLYGGRGVSPERAPRVVEPQRRSPEPRSPQSAQSRLARTNRWVKDRAVSPALHRPQPLRQSTSPHFQSLGDALQPQQQQDPPKPSRKRADHAQDDSALSTRELNPVFGQHRFPPTPDTMLTHPSTHSSTSIIQERSIVDMQAPLPRAYRGSMPESLAGDLHTHSAEFLSSSAMFPRADDAYGTDSEDEAPLVPPHHGRHTFGQSLIPPDKPRPRDPDSERRSASYNNPILPTNLYELHQTDPQVASMSTASSPRGGPSLAMRTLNHITFDDAPEPPAHKRSISATPTQPFFNLRPLSEFEPIPANTDISEAPWAKEAPAPPPHNDDSFTDRLKTTPPRPMTPEGPGVSAVTSEQTASAPSKADLIRQRVSKFGRRNNASQDNTPRPATSTPRHNRNGSFGRRTKQFFRRNSNSQGQTTSPRSPKSPQMRRSGTAGDDLDSEESSIDTGRKSAFMNAAQAAAPYLDMLGNQHKQPVRGIPSGIPMYVQGPSGPVEARSVSLGGATTAQPISPTETTARAMKMSGGKLFPRRGKDGEDVELPR